MSFKKYDLAEYENFYTAKSHLQRSSREASTPL